MKTASLASLVAFITAYTAMFAFNFEWPQVMTNASIGVAIIASLISMLAALIRHLDDELKRRW